MAGNSFELNIDLLISSLDVVDDSVNRGVNKVIRASAEPLKENIESNVNRSNLNHHHAMDDVIIGRAGGGREEKFVDVGYEYTAWRMWFVEFGTYSKGSPKGIKPQHNVQRAIGSSADQVRAIQVAGLRELINRGAG